MAIQNRRGIYSDFDPTKMVEGEFAVVQSGDPNTSDGKAVYIAPTTGTAERVALYKDLQQEVQAAITDATDEVIQEVTAGIIEGVAEDVTKAETAATNAETSAQNAEQSAQDAEASVEEAQEVLENKADNNGYYPDLYAGNLSSTRKQTDTVPYLMRKTGGDLSRVGEREDDTLVGGTVNVNQLVQNGDFADGTSKWSTRYATISANNGIATFTPTSDGTMRGIVQTGNPNAVISNHKYLLSAVINPTVAMAFNLSFGGASGKTTAILPANTWTRAGVIWTYAEPTFNCNIAVYGNGTMTTEQTAQVRNVYAIDLTAKFGSTIADYLYNLETATAGSGIAKLREWGFLTDEYIPYNPGSLESVEATAHKMVGFNQWDEEWEVGLIAVATGQNINGTGIRSKNMCKCLSNTIYYVTIPYTYSRYIFWYDSNGDFISQIPAPGSGIVTPPSNARYFRLRIDTVLTYNHDICINLSNPDRNGEYEPYSAHTYDLGTDTLRGLFKLDSNNNLYADGDTKTSDGTITRRYKDDDMGTLNWMHWQAQSLFYVKIPTKAQGSNNFITSKYPTLQSGGFDKLSDKQIVGSQTNSYIYVKDTSYSDAATFKTAMSGVMLVYELATPTTETSTSFQNPQICDPDGTEEYVTSNGVPVGHETEYPYDLKGLVEGLIDVPDVPSATGTYVLKATRSASGVAYNWVSE